MTDVVKNCVFKGKTYFLYTFFPRYFLRLIFVWSYKNYFEIILFINFKLPIYLLLQNIVVTSDNIFKEFSL